MMIRHFRLRLESNEAIFKRLPHAKNQVSVLVFSINSFEYFGFTTANNLSLPRCFHPKSCLELPVA